MERMTKKEQLAGHTVNYVGVDDCFDVWSVPKKFMGNAIDRLAAYEDTGLEPEEIAKIREDVENGYMKSTARRYGISVDRLRELAEADREGRCVVLEVKPGEKVRPKQSPYRDPEIVDCVTIYTGGKITYGFHEIGNKLEWVDRWEEEDAEAYIPDKAALKGEQDG